MISPYRQRSMKYHMNTLPQTLQSTHTGLATRLRRAAALACIGALAFTACGSDGEPVSAGSADENGIEDAADPGNTVDTDAGVQDKNDEGELEDYEQAIADGADDPASDYIQPIDEPLDAETAAQWKRLIEADVVAPGDIVDPIAWEIEDVIAVSADATEIIVRYTASNPPCSQSRATVVETDDTIEVSLEVGLHPNVAAMSCLAGTSGAEIVVPLANPVGDRAIVAIQP